MRFLKSRNVLGHGPACISIDDAGKIAQIGPYEDAPAGAIDHGELTIMPAVVDTHVHINEPGRTEWEGFRTATESAAAGGIATLVDMPLNSSPVTTTLRALEEKREAARGQLNVDVGYWGGVVPGNVSELAPMAALGALGFKCFLVDSGIEEFGYVEEADLRPAMAELARLQRPLLVHAEVAAGLREPQGDPLKYQTYLDSRPRESENLAVSLAARLCAETRARTHIVHHSSSDALAILQSYKNGGALLTAETCPHYLRFAAEDIPDGHTEFKCSPPIRERANREALWAALDAGVLDFIASDHSPCSPALKSQDFDKAWGGISGLQLALSIIWTEASQRGFDLQRVARWMCEGPAMLAGLDKRKGKIAPGYDADLCIFDPLETFTVTRETLRHKHKLSPYLGATLRGVVHGTYLRGSLIYDGREVIGAPRGQELLR